MSREKLKRLIQEAIREKLMEDALSKKIGNRVRGRVLDIARNQDEREHDTVRGYMDNLGFNPEYTQEGSREALQGLYDENGNINQETHRRIKDAIKILRDKDVIMPNGAIKWQNVPQVAQKLGITNMTTNDVVKLKDFIDSISLSNTYDSSIRIKSPSFKFGLDKNAPGISKGGAFDVISDEELEKLDLNNFGQDEVRNWRGAGKTNDDGSNARKDKYDTEDKAIAQIKENILNKYLVSTYGVELKEPTSNKGNQKVKDCLLINFTSAFRCPAWNTCLVKHACYAKSSEKTYYATQKRSNDTKNLLWLTATIDDEVMSLMEQFIRASVVKYRELADCIMNNPEAKSKVESGAYSFMKDGKIDLEALVAYNFKDLDDSILALIKDDSYDLRKVKYIRLNENGDFINQTILDKIDEIAGDFDNIEVTTAAYTCSTLDFSKIKNIVVNASRPLGKGRTGKSVYRYFYAVPEDMYDKMTDTYSNKVITDDEDSIQRLPQPLGTIKGEQTVANGNYYYKCPCGRGEGDFEFNLTNGSKNKVNCYQCRLCYNRPNTDQTTAEGQALTKMTGDLIVFVKAHGAMKKALSLDRQKEIAKQVGVPLDYDTTEIRHGIDQNDIMGVRRVDEAYGNGQRLANSDEAFKVITKNAIDSMNDLFKTF